MRSLVSNNGLRCLSQVAFIGIMAGFATGCSSDFTRFDRNLYAALPQSQAQQANNAYPDNVDRMTTASIGTSSPNPTPLGAVSQRSALPDHVASQTYNQPVSQNAYSNNQPTYTPTPNYDSGVVRQALPKPTVTSQALPSARSVVDPIKTGAISNVQSAIATPKPLVAAAPAVAAAASNRVGGWTGAGGTAINIQSGETLYNVSKRYGVPVKEIMRVNNIQDASSVRVGQQVVIPTYIYSQNAPISAPDNNPGTKAASAYRGNLGQADPNNVAVPTKSPQQMAALNTNNAQPSNTIVQPRAKPKPWTEDGSQESVPDYSIVTGSVGSSSGSYTVVSGDSLSKIASRYNVGTSSLMQVNGLQNSNIRIGQSLKIPGTAAATQVAKATTSSKVAEAPQKYVKPTVDKTVTNSVDTKAPAATGIDVLRWPVSGKVVTAFGASKNGQPNDGIDISVPEGTAVKAAENGVVIYSGSDLENFGNLVLIRHAGGLVTAYAHNKSNSVAKNTQVTRGQVIAVSGRTGSATSPMLHFEVRKDSKPVNPIKYLGG